MNIVNNVTKLPKPAIENILSSLTPKDRAALASTSREHGNVVRNTIVSKRAQQEIDDMSRLVTDLAKLKAKFIKHYPFIMYREIRDIDHLQNTIEFLGAHWEMPNSSYTNVSEVSDSFYRGYMLRKDNWTPAERGELVSLYILKMCEHHDRPVTRVKHAMRLIEAMVKEYGTAYISEVNFREMEEDVNSNLFTKAIVNAIPGITVEGAVEGGARKRTNRKKKALVHAISQK